MTKDPIVAFLPAGLDACAYYRHFMPHLHLKNSRFVFSYHQMPIADFCEADVAVVQRQCTEGNFLAFKAMKQMGMKVIYDLDDNLWAVPNSNPTAPVFKAVKEGLNFIASKCDVITVSTPQLRLAVQRAMPNMGLRIEVVPNMIDLDWCHPPLLPRDPKRVTLGWAGSNTHAGDIGYAWEALPVALEKVPHLYMEFVGMAPPKSIANHPRVKARSWYPTAEFPARFSSWGWDICIAPLEDSRFNKSKSAIKMLEAGAVGAVILVSPVGPYKDFCKLHPELPYLECVVNSQWINKIVELATDHAKRQYYADLLRETVIKHYEVKSHIHIWEDLLRSL
jgi:glycosyltransferase involved in cell wall biosynthesis